MAHFFLQSKGWRPTMHIFLMVLWMLDVAEFPYSFIMPAFRDPMLSSFGNLHRYSVPSFSSGCDQSLQFFSLKFYTFPFLSFVLVLIFRVGFSLISLRAFLFWVLGVCIPFGLLSCSHYRRRHIPHNSNRAGKTGENSRQVQLLNVKTSLLIFLITEQTSSQWENYQSWH